MAFAKKTHRILAGSLNYASPGDKIGEPNALRLINFRVDELGRLRSRRGVERVNPAHPTNPTDIHTVMRSGHSSGLYLAAGHTLHADTGATSLVGGLSNFDGARVGWANFGDFIWFMNRGFGITRGPLKRHKSGGSVRDWTPAAPTSAPTIAAGAAGSLSGDYYVYITFTTAYGHESNPSPITAVVTLAAEQISLTGIPTSPDAQVSARRIYVQGGTLGAAYLAYELGNNSSTSLSFDTAEDLLTQLGNPILELDHFEAPRARGLTGPYFNRLIAFSTADNPNRYFWTPTNQPWYFPDTNFNDVGGADSPLLAVTHHKRILAFYKPDGIWRLIGDPGTSGGDQEQTNANFGPLGDAAVANAGNIDYLVGPDGVYRFNFDTLQDISRNIKPLFQGRFVAITDSFGVAPLSTDPAARATSVLGWDGSLLRFSYPEEGQPFPNITLVYDPALGSWSQEQIASAVGMGDGYRAFLYDPTINVAYGSGRDGYVYHLDHGQLDHTSPFFVAYVSHYDDLGLPDNFKILEDIEIEGDTSGENLTIKLFLDDGETEIAIGSFNSVTFPAGRRIYPIREGVGYAGQIGVRARNYAISIEGTVSQPNVSHPIQITDIVIHYRLEVRLGRTFDSGPTNLGTNQVKAIDALQFELEAEAAVTWTILTDLPGRNLVERDSAAFAATSGRKTQLVLLPAPPDGARLQVTLESDAPFRLHSAQLRRLVYGEYLDGSAGEFFETEELSLVA